MPTVIDKTRRRFFVEELGATPEIVTVHDLLAASEARFRGMVLTVDSLRQMEEWRRGVAPGLPWKFVGESEHQALIGIALVPA